MGLEREGTRSRCWHSPCKSDGPRPQISALVTVCQKLSGSEDRTPHPCDWWPRGRLQVSTLRWQACFRVGGEQAGSLLAFVPGSKEVVAPVLAARSEIPESSRDERPGAGVNRAHASARLATGRKRSVAGLPGPPACPLLTGRCGSTPRTGRSPRFLPTSAGSGEGVSWGSVKSFLLLPEVTRLGQ